MFSLSLSLISLLLFSLFLVVLLLYKWLSVTSSSEPPSPPKLPIIGNLHQLGSLPHRSLQKLSKQYGPLMQLHFGKVPVVVISSADLACQVMKTNDLIFASRPKLSFPDRLLYGSRDIALAPYGEHWKMARSICVLHLLSAQRVKFCKNVRDEETTLMLQKIEKLSSFGSINLTDSFVSLTNDIVCRVALGRKYSDRQDWSDLMSALMESVKMLGHFNVEDYIPWLGWVNNFTGLNAKYNKLCKKNDNFLELVIEEHRKKMENNGGDWVSEDNEDFVDILLKLQNAGDEYINKETIKGVVWDMFAAGTAPPHSALEWAMSELLKNPKTMEKLQYEVRKVVQRKSTINEDDTLKMKYLKAVIKETLRLHAPVPLLLPRETTQDVKLMGYDIKSGTQTIINAWAIGRDPAYWDNVEAFEPERFLNSNIDYKGFDFELIPFGAGRRGCPGVGFATILLELALAKLVNKFDFSLPNGLKWADLDMTEINGIVVHRNSPLLVDVSIFEI